MVSAIKGAISSVSTEQLTCVISCCNKYTGTLTGNSTGLLSHRSGGQKPAQGSLEETHSLDRAAFPRLWEKIISPFLHLQDCQPFLFLCLAASEQVMPFIALLSVVTSPSDHSGERFSEFTNVSAWGPSGQLWVNISSWNCELHLKGSFCHMR